MIVWLIAVALVAAEPTDAEKLARIAAGKETLDRAYRIRTFAKEGEIDAEGRFVMVDGKVYFKTSDQSYIPESGRFPYPELFFEVHTSQDYAYRPLIANGILKGNRVLDFGPVRVKGNWAYEAPFHIFGLVWVDDVNRIR
jgi:hypothetical protein